jgi:hypothetical protein
MIRATGRYHQQTVRLDAPLALEEGTKVIIDVLTDVESVDSDPDWADAAMSRFEETWDNSADAIYDNWRTLYDVPSR